jgi:two-component system sensor kinase FixL
VREILADIVTDDTRASEVIRRIRALVKKEERELAALDLSNITRDVFQLVHSDAMLRNVRISLRSSSEFPLVHGDRVQLQQVILNLLLNAFGAMKDCPADQREVSVHLASNGTDKVEVAVCDRGTGLPSDKLDKFSSHFTPPNVKDWAWDGRLAVRLSKPMEESSGLKTMPAVAQRFTSNCRLLVMARKEAPASE